MEDDLKNKIKMEDDLKKKKKGRRAKKWEKMEDEQINQNQPNWL